MPRIWRKCHCCYHRGQSPAAVGAKKELECSLARGQPAGSTEKRTAQPLTAVDSPSHANPMLRLRAMSRPCLPLPFACGGHRNGRNREITSACCALAAIVVRVTNKSKLVPFRVSAQVQPRSKPDPSLTQARPAPKTKKKQKEKTRKQKKTKPQGN